MKVVLLLLLVAHTRPLVLKFQLIASSSCAVKLEQLLLVPLLRLGILLSRGL
jgi:hypothetical protein